MCGKDTHTQTHTKKNARTTLPHSLKTRLQCHVPTHFLAGNAIFEFPYAKRKWHTYVCMGECMMMMGVRFVYFYVVQLQGLRSYFVVYLCTFMFMYQIIIYSLYLSSLSFYSYFDLSVVWLSSLWQRIFYIATFLYNSSLSQLVRSVKIGRGAR